MKDDDVGWMRLDDTLTLGTPTLVETRSSSKTKTKAKAKASTSRKRSNHITLEDLWRENKERKSKQQRRSRVSQKADGSSSGTDDAEEEEDDSVNKIKSQITNLEKESFPIDEKASLQKWGEKVFYQQTPLETSIDLSEDWLQSDPEKEPATEGLLLRGLLHSLAIAEGRCDERTIRRVFYQMIESPNELLEIAACHFLCDLLTLQRADCKPACRFEWFPTSAEIMKIFRSYGYRRVSSGSVTSRSYIAALKSVSEPASKSGELEGPPPNIRSFVTFLESLFQTRHLHQTLSASEAADLVVTLVHCQMDRCLEALNPSFQSCLTALVHYFSEEEWAASRLRIATSLSCLSTDPLNQVWVAKTLHAGDSRLCALQKSVVILLLGRSVQRDLKTEADVVSVFKSQDMKRRNYDFLNLYLQLTLADMYLWSEPRLKKGGFVHGDWIDFMKRVTACVPGSDERPHATKVRSSMASSAAHQRTKIW
ncbi:hypothetical protein R1sor_011858 [Riccia sorocarpa]|uniref:Coiled-coil SMC6 And NSE5 INteracting (CANIN) domain-containing protein n=1 Tax=Riccia sorocarpa TaxID=122646 RepID=A0ABD3I622_9MARC